MLVKLLWLTRYWIPSAHESFTFTWKQCSGSFYDKASQGGPGGPYSWLSAGGKGDLTWRIGAHWVRWRSSRAVCCRACEVSSSLSMHIYWQVLLAVNLYLAFEVSASVICLWQQMHHCWSLLRASLAGHWASKWIFDKKHFWPDPKASITQCSCAQQRSDICLLQNMTFKLFPTWVELLWWKWSMKVYVPTMEFTSVQEWMRTQACVSTSYYLNMKYSISMTRAEWGERKSHRNLGPRRNNSFITSSTVDGRGQIRPDL